MALVGSVRNTKRIESVMECYRPDIVFHAAAHKHVPLMEDSPNEAIKNNVLGTYKTATAASKAGVKKFVLISTDKAVNPTNIMGASKRMCEKVILCRGDSKTSFAAVRFGNVLGSNGSVIPLFKRQIASGGPVTITDKRIIRYFMTIQEASQLVIQAGAMAKRGELFILDMGKPVKIYDLAVNMIKLSGLEPNKDIMIEEIGLRPGEKLYEELLLKSDTHEKTDNNLIFIERDTPLSREEVAQLLEELDSAAEAHDVSLVRTALIRAVPTYKDSALVNSAAGQAREMQMVN
jgi:FlaA1/EpsC-like NDP-sugar epimerase